MRELLSIEEMYKADRLTIEAGAPGETLMENAGRGIAEIIQTAYERRPVLVLCGPGNNGGDGFVVARHLQEAGWEVSLAALVPPDRYKKDAAIMAKRWQGETLGIKPALLEELGVDDRWLIVDALFGAGLDRQLEGMVNLVLKEVGKREIPVVAVDMPSGVSGDSGLTMGAVAPAEITVTFFRKKPGHLLLPGRKYCGEVIVRDIGIETEVLDEIKPQCRENSPELWHDHLPVPRLSDNKYSRGSVLIASGSIHSRPVTTGAAKLAAMGARRMGAGLVTILADTDTLPVFASQMMGCVLTEAGDSQTFEALLQDKKRTGFLAGPGTGVNECTKEMTLKMLATGRPCVLDADALTVFEESPDELFQAIKGPCILTPHLGEFRRLFELHENKLDMVRAASQKAGAVIILKGGDTVIAAPDGRTVINANAPAWLATAGSGDVLAGMCLALAGQGMEPFEAACAAVWLHGEAGNFAGPGLVAEDLPEMIPEVLDLLY